ncbi:MAG: hypothetical protein V7K48_03650 [Nostoc sp.]
MRFFLELDREIRVIQAAARNFDGRKVFTKQSNEQKLLIGFYIVLFER